jgi:hypothetical protein
MRFNPAILVSLVLLAAPYPALGHHSQSMYDNAQDLEISGTVDQWEWRNPHCWLHVVIPDENGVERMWTFESNSTGQLERAGWSGDAIEAGDEVRIVYRPLKDGTRGGSIRAVYFPDGTALLHPGIGGYDPETGELYVPAN